MRKSQLKVFRHSYPDGPLYIRTKADLAKYGFEAVADPEEMKKAQKFFEQCGLK